jgi:hypothetical protein
LNLDLSLLGFDFFLVRHRNHFSEAADHRHQVFVGNHPVGCRQMLNYESNFDGFIRGLEQPLPAKK